VFRADRDYTKWSAARGGGKLIAACKLFRGVKRRLDLEIINECVWIEIPTKDNYNLLLGNNCTAAVCNVKIIKIILIPWNKI
jgi:hypothetical protein